MNIPNVEMYADDLFILGNLADGLIERGRGDDAKKIYKFIQKNRKTNAAAFLLEAKHINIAQGPKDAATFVEKCGMLYAPKNKEYLQEYFLYLLKELGRQLDVESRAKEFISQCSDTKWRENFSKYTTPSQGVDL